MPRTSRIEYAWWQTAARISPKQWAWSLDLTERGLGLRSDRYAMIVDDDVGHCAAPRSTRQVRNQRCRVHARAIVTTSAAMPSSHPAPPDELDAPLELDPSDWDTQDNYLLLTELVIPRPVAWVSTISADGALNLAPHSYFNAVASDPLARGCSAPPV